jgi:hypothetical protein
MMHIGSSLSVSSITICDTVVPVVRAKDLGVTFDSKLSFLPHISALIAAARLRANLIHKCFLSKDRASLVRAFVVYVRLMVESCSSVWSPLCSLY